MNPDYIRNFAIIAHVDHGKSTLADRFLELTGLVQKGQHEAQMLDRNPISRERGITIKLAPVTLNYLNQGTEYQLNLVDTPGHVDFSYEVQRTLACVEGVVLLVDATQGIQAQTISHCLKALELNLKIIPVVNKVDLETAEVEKTISNLAAYLGVDQEKVIKISAKTGFGVQELLTVIAKEVPSPKTTINQDEVEALIFDSYYDEFRGVIAFVRLISGRLHKNQMVKLLHSDKSFLTQEVGIFKPQLTASDDLILGQIGYVVTNLKDIHEVRVGDRITSTNSLLKYSEGYKPVKPMIFASIFTTDPNEYPNLKKALEKLYLNDSALEFEAIYSKALGSGFRVGFLGMLHADVTVERLEREFGQDLILTPPKVDYKKKDDKIFEPYVNLTVITPNRYLGAIMKLCSEMRAFFINMNNVHPGNLNITTDMQIILHYEMPLSELVSNFFDKLKNATSGFASLDWDFLEYRPVIADKLEILLNNEIIDEFSEIVVQERSVEKAKAITSALSELIPRQQFEVRIQARYKGRILASEHISPFRKDVTAKLYGGDRTRKDKLLKKQKKGKKLMKQVGKIEIPKETFLKLFKIK